MKYVLAEVLLERLSQIDKWGHQHKRLPSEWLLILSEEFGEVAKEVNEMYFRSKSSDEYRKELIQVAAVAVAAIEALDRT